MVALAIPTDAPVVSGPPQGQWTHADWERLPHDQARFEIISGLLYVTTTPSFFHQWIVRGLYKQLGIPAENSGMAYAATSRVGLLMPGCDPVQPDFVIVLAERKAIIQDRRIRGVPDLIIEVLSPGNPNYDQVVKKDAYAQAGVPEYGIVDPALETLTLYHLAQPGQYAEPQVFERDAVMHFACLPTLSLHVADLFAGAPDTTL